MLTVIKFSWLDDQGNKIHQVLMIDSHCFSKFAVNCGYHFQGCLTLVTTDGGWKNDRT